jgi:hypothetical protein
VRLFSALISRSAAHLFVPSDRGEMLPQVSLSFHLSSHPTGYRLSTASCAEREDVRCLCAVTGLPPDRCQVTPDNVKPATISRYILINMSCPASR